MVSRQRRTPLLRLLGRLGWQRDPDLWTVHCLDEHGRPARILVQLRPEGVVITLPELGSLQLSGWQALQLRVALRDAVQSLGQLNGSADVAEDPPVEPPAHPPNRRQRVPVEIPARPSVSEIAARLTNP